MRVEVPQAGLVVVSYESAAELLPELQTPVIDAIAAQGDGVKVAVVFDLASRVTAVELSVPSFWLELMSTRPVTALGIVTTSAAVRIAARGFKLAQAVRNAAPAVETHATLDEALTWARSFLA